MLLPACERQKLSVEPVDPLPGAKPPTADEVSTFSHRTGFVVPASAKASHFYSVTGWMDDSFAIQFAIPSVEYQQFITSSPLPASALRQGNPDEPSRPLHYFRSWLPRTPKNHQFADTIIPESRGVQCVIDFDDPQTTVIYLRWFET